GSDIPPLLHCFHLVWQTGQRDAEQETYMTRLTNLTPAEKQFLDDAVAAAERASGKKLNQPNRHIVLNRARAQIESQRHADRQRALREEERQQAEVTWSRPRSPRR
ncbi:UNVERIFIED_CONTAM: hypothetical protein QO022_43070, partial [Pseudomonas aeruginosa]